MLLLLFGGWRLVLLLFGLAFGLVISFFPLLLVGFIGYSVFKSIQYNAGIQSGIRNTSTDHQQFTELLIRIIAHVINSDNRVDDKEISTVIRCFQRIGFPQNRMNWLLDLLQTALHQNPDLETLCRAFNQQFQYQSKLILLDMLYQIAISDGVISPDELDIINRISQLLYISDRDNEQLYYQYYRETTDRHTASPSKRAYYLKLLGLSGDPSASEIKTAYKTACKKYHPDKVQHLGPEYQAVANKKIKTITEAYQYLKK